MINDPRHQQDENALDQELESVRSAWTRLENEDPPAMLDQAVLNRAKRALEEQEKSGARQKSIKWLGAFASAAVVVLALTVVLEQESQGPGTMPQEYDRLLKDSDGIDRPEREDAPEAQPQKTMAKKFTASESGDKAQTETPGVKQELRESAAPALELDAGSEGVLAEAEEMPDEVLPANTWVEQLLQLQQSREFDKLAIELARFRSVYPDHPLPPELDD